MGSVPVVASTLLLPPLAGALDAAVELDAVAGQLGLVAVAVERVVEPDAADVVGAVAELLLLPALRASAVVALVFAVVVLPAPAHQPGLLLAALQAVA